MLEMNINKFVFNSKKNLFDFPVKVIDKNIKFRYRNERSLCSEKYVHI
jgi:hypothetical protein